MLIILAIFFGISIYYKKYFESSYDFYKKSCQDLLNLIQYSWKDLVRITV